MLLTFMSFVGAAMAANVFYDNAGDVTLNSSVVGSVYVDNYWRTTNPYSTPTHLTIAPDVMISNQRRTYGRSSVLLTGNSSFGGILNMDNFSSVTMTGTSRANSDIGIWASSTITLRENASVAGLLDVGHSSSIHLYVSSFAVDGQVLTQDAKLSDYGTGSTRANYPLVGTISGTMEHGLAFSNNFEIFNTGTYSGSADIFVHVVPEPASALLMLLGAACMGARRKR